MSIQLINLSFDDKNTQKQINTVKGFYAHLFSFKRKEYQYFESGVSNLTEDTLFDFFFFFDSLYF